MAEGITREEFHRGIDSLRHEFNAGLTTAGVQIGAVEKSLLSKIGNVKVWGISCLIGGQALAGLIAAVVGPGKAAGGANAALHSFGQFLGLL